MLKTLTLIGWLAGNAPDKEHTLHSDEDVIQYVECQLEPSYPATVTPCAQITSRGFTSPLHAWLLQRLGGPRLPTTFRPIDYLQGVMAVNNGGGRASPGAEKAVMELYQLTSAAYGRSKNVASFIRSVCAVSLGIPEYMLRGGRDEADQIYSNPFSDFYLSGPART